jgi:hypothetical protein
MGTLVNVIPAREQLSTSENVALRVLVTDADWQIRL